MNRQEKVSATLNALHRRREPSPSEECLRCTVLAAIPNIEVMELVVRFFEVRAEVVGTMGAVELVAIERSERLAASPGEIFSRSALVSTRDDRAWRRGRADQFLLSPQRG